MKRFLALLLSSLMLLSLLAACGAKQDDAADGGTPPVTDDSGSGEAPPDDGSGAADPAADPYDAVRNYWSADQLTQAWGPEQLVEHLFFHPIIAYPQWAFHDCAASQDQRYGLDDWMVTVDE